MTAVISCKPQHSGHHPVTMRSLASPKAGCTTPSAAAVVETKTNLTSTTPPSRTATSPPDIQDTTQNYIIETPDILTHSTPNIPTKNNVSINIDQLELENSSLKNTITDLKKQLRDVTDRAIASDTRLLQYTNEVFELPHGFVGNICPSITTEVVDEQLGTRVEDNEADEDSARVHESSTHVAGSPGTETAAVSAVHQTIPAEHSSQSIENLLKLERDKNEELRKQILSLRVELPCRKCKIYEEETKKMISTLRLFEAESRELKAKINSSNFKISNDKIYLQKESESTAAPAEEGVAFTVVTKKTSKKKKRKPKKHGKKTYNSAKPETGTGNQIKTGNPETTPMVKLPFKNVTVIGDSHSRHLASLMCKNSRGTNIGGICKPGTGLLSVTPALVHPPDHCCVLLAGTNDVAAGKQDIIFSKLEKIVKDCCSSSALLVLSLPTRHDLPSDSPVHQTTALVNNYIAELCIRYEGAEMLDISNMDRSHFTPHGLHLRASGKQLLADLILQRISGMMPRPRRRVTAVTAPIRSTPSPTPDPVTLPYSTYAEAVIGTSQPLTTDILNASMKTVSKNCLVMYSAKID
ncbi:hypothetical protein J6590_007603 [Homalodisca vitripennis]|nr:hypothetical protein J6590_007603 [Homalodisca vitripennis]